MFGTIARVTVQGGQEAEFMAIGEAWSAARGAATGQVAECVFKVEGHERVYFIVGIFRDRETYRANAADPETDRWYRRMRATLEADPEWNDGEVVQAVNIGGI